jgi:ATP-binding cassette subfamily B protein
VKIPLKQYLRLLVDYLRPQWASVVLLAVLLFGNIGLQLVNPQIMRRFIDVTTQAAQADGTLQALVRMALLFIGVALVQQAVAVAATYVSENVGWTATNALRATVADHCMGLDMSFHNEHTPGEMIERVDGDVTALSNFFSQFVIQLAGNLLLLVGVLVLLYREDWRVGLAMTGFVTLALFIVGKFRNIAVPHWKAQRETMANLFGFLEERLAGTEDIRSCGAKPYVMRRFFELIRDVYRKTLKAFMAFNVMLNTMVVFFAVGNAVAFAVGAWLFRSNLITIGTVYIIFHYTEMLMRPIDVITQQMQPLQQAGAGIVRIQELLGIRSKIKQADSPTGAGLEQIGAGPLAVEFHDVTFGYKISEPDDAPDDASSDASVGAPTGAPTDGVKKDIVLHDLSFRVEPGRVLGLLGRTGSGKTTLTRLLFRLYDPDAGQVCLGADARPVDVREMALLDLRQRVGMVTQNIQLFHATVRDNLTFFDAEFPDDKILEVIHDLGMDQWLASLPEGLDTELESGGGGLSAGEAQLLAFTRIFLQDPGLVILDEASSRLDPATEHLIERAVDKLVQGRTAIVIAHRLRTVERADEIMILEDGRICEHGERTALAGDPGSRFYSLLQTGLEEVLA